VSHFCISIANSPQEALLTKLSQLTVTVVIFVRFGFQELKKSLEKHPSGQSTAVVARHKVQEAYSIGLPRYISEPNKTKCGAGTSQPERNFSLDKDEEHGS